ncbi:hypothetical protein AXG93_2278s1330 [Marchantia polymorpha subsp. ruderalis]|uniref:Uncharacterized protein n=1 Tax=Marchantia polymorpha subsp. ruderalis TaxID=1480154 RepID=A0A176WHG5_MARPO|nr:hypothetical protein AXG93_2278s1330 [Marchantia polymorpha subsp. ruderalis]
MENFRLRKGPYRGDVSALCLVSSPVDRRLLLAGTGPHLLLYEILTGTLLSSIDAFDGVRVHGICCGPAIRKKSDPTSSSGETRLFTVLVHGERRVKVFEMLSVHKDENPQLKLLQSLPRFSHWVMDVRLFPSKQAETQIPHAAGTEEVMLMAVGLSNNTICLWDLSNSAILYRVECSERLLLYSMRLWGDSPETLHAGVGTIFNEVLVWRVGRQVAEVEDSSRRLTAQREAQVLQGVPTHRCSEPLTAIEEVVEPLQTLAGHEGSIYRLTWAIDGLTLVSVSDDRSARVWHSGGRDISTGDQWVLPVKVGPVLYGHGARLWDCYVSEKLLITASEDCTCRIWTTDGNCLTTLKGHQGRGIWRCVYDPDLNVVVTAGADSSIKIQSLDKWSQRIDNGVLDRHIDSNARGSQSKQEVFSIDPVWSDATVKGSGYLDSKSEYVRCMRLSDQSSLYIGTNQGYVYHVQLSQKHEPGWTTLVDNLGAPVVCMDVLVQSKSKKNEDLRDEDYHQSGDMVVVGDGKGNVTVVLVKTGGHTHCGWRYTWAAEKERQLLGVFWCKSLEGRFVFTTDPKGAFLMWRLSDMNHGDSASNRSPDTRANDDAKVAEKKIKDTPVLVAVGKCSYGRVVCMDVCPTQQLIVCGGKQGSLTVFSFPRNILENREDKRHLLHSSSETPLELQSVAVFKGAHGISAVTHVSFVPKQSGEQAKILSTGRDGCVCRFHLESHVAATVAPQMLSCSGIEKVAAVSMLECLEHTNGAPNWTNLERKIAVGFTGSDFLLWDTTHKSELLRVTCGGWRRPFSYIVGEMPDFQHAFVFVKGQVIQVHRHWINSIGAALAKAELDVATQSLRGQFHGKEINSVQIFRCVGAQAAIDQSVMIATGAEDGTVRISSYLEAKQEQLDANSVLGDHVGGSAVRSLTLVDKIHSLGKGLDLTRDPGERLESCSGDGGRSDTRQFLFSAGAKEVLTCWLLDWLPETLDGEEPYVGKEKTGHTPPSAYENLQDVIAFNSSNFTSQWLSTRMPQRKRLPASSRDGEDSSAEFKNLSNLVTQLATEDDDEKGDTGIAMKVDDDDHRYLAMTAFAVRCAITRKVVCFVVTASSHAAISLHAFHVATRSWNEVATLDYQEAPVLTIEHIIAPLSSQQSGSGDAYVILTGATNGNIAFWDVTCAVADYMNSGGLDTQESVVSVSRPLTGRGSQGGRRRKTREELKLAKKSKAKLGKLKGDDPNENIESAMQVSTSCGVSEFAHDTLTSLPTDCVRSDTDELFGAQAHDTSINLQNIPATPVLSFLQEIVAPHQSGVNCMSIARLQNSGDEGSGTSELVYMVISGGDDQAIHLTTFKFMNREAEDSQGEALQQTSLVLQCLSRSTIACAHNSAVKGIWTDGSWVFSTGLDQRLRCWKIKTEFCMEQTTRFQSIVVDSEGQESDCPLVECMSCVIDTPEAASLHVSSNPLGKYHIAVVGRGLQVINFDSMCDLR